jgi:hypothetical protein
MARILGFNTQGTIKASRDLPYDADGGTVLVAPGEGRPGPGRSLLFRIEEAGDSKSGILHAARKTYSNRGSHGT